jgi:hypothetical protein
MIYKTLANIDAYNLIINDDDFSYEFIISLIENVSINCSCI